MKEESRKRGERVSFYLLFLTIHELTSLWEGTQWNSCTILFVTYGESWLMIDFLFFNFIFLRSQPRLLLWEASKLPRDDTKLLRITTIFGRVWMCLSMKINSGKKEKKVTIKPILKFHYYDAPEHPLPVFLFSSWEGILEEKKKYKKRKEKRESSMKVSSYSWLTLADILIDSRSSIAFSW